MERYVHAPLRQYHLQLLAALLCVYVMCHLNYHIFQMIANYNDEHGEDEANLVGNDNSNPIITAHR